MRILFSCILVILLSAVARADSFDLHYQPSTIKITTPDKGVIAAPSQFYNGWPSLRAARGEWESFQIIITARKVLLKDVHIEPQSFENPLGAPILKNSWMIFRENYVQIPHPSARNSPPNLWWPDALIPQNLQPRISIDPGKSEVFWLTVRVPQNAEAGNYSSDIEVWANGEKQTVKVLLHVEPFAIPAPTMRANVAVYYDVLRDWYSKNIGKMSDTQFAKLKKEYYDFLLQYRINAYDLPVPWNSPQASQYINNPKVLSVRLPPLSQKKEFKTAISVLKRNHAMAKGYYYYIDEPSPDRYPEIINTEKQLREIDPAIKQCVTISPNKMLDGSVDIWCPNIGDFLGLGHLDFGALAEQREKGRETWWYTMVEPKYPYPTWLVDDEALSVRRYGGLMARYGISGFVYSMAHGWGPDPLNNITSFAGTYGDGTLVYPSELIGGHGPMPSIRLMLLRDAMEDYELMKKYFYTKEEIPKNLKNDFDVFYRMYATKTFRPSAPADENSQIIRFAKLRNDLYDVLDRTQTDAPKSWPVLTLPPLVAFQIPSSPEGKLFPQRDELRSTIESEDKSMPIAFPATLKNLFADDKDLHVTIQAEFKPQLTADWMAVELSNAKPAPENGWGYQWINASTAGVTRWRFIITRKGRALLEKQTSEGRFVDDTITWQHQLSISTEVNAPTYTATFSIPRSLFPEMQEGKRTFRINLLRHYQEPDCAPVTMRWWQDAGDIFLMPRIEIGNSNKD